jgi:hypothetical protein
MNGFQSLVRLASAALVVVFLPVSPALAQADLAVWADDIDVVKSSTYNLTYVTVTVHNDGANASEAFALRIGVSDVGSSMLEDFTIPAIPAGQSETRMATFSGIGWRHAWGNADVGGVAPETDETNNCANESHNWIALGPAMTHDEFIGVVNPGIDPEMVSLNVNAPQGWVVTVNPQQFIMSPGEHRGVLVQFEAPDDFKDYACVEIECTFQDDTPGVLVWDFHIESTVPVRHSTWGVIKSLFAR